MSELGYIVKVNGLFPIVEKKSKKAGKGLMEQIHGTNTHVYENLTLERLEEALNEFFRERPIPTIVGGAAAHEMFNQAFRDQLITGESSFRVGIDPINENSEPIVTRVTRDSIVERMRPMQDDYNRAMLEMDQALLRARTQNSVHTTREDLQRHAAQRLQRGEISAMEYLDLISQQE